MQDRQIHELMKIAAKRFSFDTDIEVVGRIAKLLQSENLKLRLDNDSADIREAECYAEHRIESFKKENAR